MSNEPLCITDPNVRIQNPYMNKLLQKYQQNKIKDAEQQEIKLMNKKGIGDLIIETFILIQKHRRNKTR